MATVPDDVTIRAATVDDAEAIAEVQVVSWRWAYDGLLPASVLDALSVEGRAGDWRSMITSQVCDVSVATAGDGTIVGFVSVGANRDDEAREPGTGEVFALYVLPEKVGTGLGRALLRHGESRLCAAGCTRATLWVLETNGRGRRFYERHGWSFDGARSEHRFDCGNRPIVRYAREL
jgi:ribosomal protein S18 acetylase RimI-like enzyme